MAKADTKLKHRVVGAVVLTTLAIVILPMLLDGSAAERAEILAQIPDAPTIQSTELRVESVLEQMEKREAESHARLPATKSPQTTLPEATSARATEQDSSKTGKAATDASSASLAANMKDSLKHDAEGLPAAWSLQVGSFSKKENAFKLRETLRNSSHQSYIYKAVTDKGETYRVFIGPVMNKTILEAIADEVKTDFKLEGQIVKHDVGADKDLVGG